MLEVSRIRTEKEAIAAALKKRNVDAMESLEKVLSLDDKRKTLQAAADELQHEANDIARQIGELFKQGKREEAETMKARPTILKEEIHGLKEKMTAVESEIRELLYTLPNAPHELVPSGVTEEDNEVTFEEGEIPSLHEGAVPHWELADTYGLIDFELGVKVTGAGFPVYTGKGAKLQRALIAFFLR